MKITDLKCTVLGQNPVVRITTDEGISGLGPVESYKPYLGPHIQFYKQMGADILPDWRICRLTGDTLDALAERRT